MLEELATKHAEGNRDYIYYLAIGNARLKQYSVSLKYCKAFLQIEPNNQQAICLEVSFRWSTKSPVAELITNYSYSTIHYLLFICPKTGAHTKENGERNHDWCGCGRRCRSRVGRIGWIGICAR